MTSPDSPSAALRWDGRPVLRVRDQGELIAAVPAMLGFHPRESLVLMATGGRSGHRLGLTLRIDLPPPGHPSYHEYVELIAASAVRGLLLDEPTGAIVLVIAAALEGDHADESRLGHTTDPPCPLPHPQLATLVALSLADRGVAAHTRLWSEGTAAGARWACYDTCGCSGLVPDPAATPFVAAAVAEGRVVRADRDELEAAVAPADEGRLRRREELLIRGTDEALGGDTPSGDGTAVSIVLDDTAGSAVVEQAIADAEAGRLALSDARVVALATALAIPAVRVAALQSCCGARAAAAEQLWAALTRETPAPEAAEPAALLAVSALLRGDGALANVALDRAERAWPGHRLSALLRTAAASGVRPSEMQAWLRRCATPEPETTNDITTSEIIPRRPA
jgi:uncharacterized protein DUF4192